MQGILLSLIDKGGMKALGIDWISIYHRGARKFSLGPEDEIDSYLVFTPSSRTFPNDHMQDFMAHNCFCGLV